MLHQPFTDKQLEQQVKPFVEGVFCQCGISYVALTKEGVVMATSDCKKNAERMMGSRGAELIEHHHAEMMKLVNGL